MVIDSLYGLCAVALWVACKRSWKSKGFSRLLAVLLTTPTVILVVCMSTPVQRYGADEVHRGAEPNTARPAGKVTATPAQSSKVSAPSHAAIVQITIGDRNSTVGTVNGDLNINYDTPQSQTGKPGEPK
jgi:hypothetical protein